MGADRVEPLLRVVLGNIEEFGHHVTGVYPAAGDVVKEWFSYTTGLSARLGIELAMATLPLPTAGPVLNTVAQRLTAAPAEGMELDQVLGGGYRVRLRRCEDTSRFTVTRAVYGSDPDGGVWQVLWPDARHRFPGEPGYNDRGCPQPVY